MATSKKTIDPSDILLSKFDISSESIKKLIVFEELIYERKANFKIINDAIHIYSV